MDSKKTGALIRAARVKKRLKQRELADRLLVSDKTVSKWETGGGCPDAGLLPALSAALGVGVDELLRGSLSENESDRGNMKRLRFYVCPQCGNILTSTGEAAVSCCGAPLRPLEARVPDEAHELTVERVEDEWFVSSRHPMEREHYISFAALLTSDRLELVRCYPEWELQTRFFRRGMSTLYWFCTKDGLFQKPIR